jgi:glycosyltransferase involved in cell wall biosynthesis
VEETVGRLVEVGDAADLEKGIAHVLDHYDSYDRDAIRRRALERFDYRRIAERIHAVYEAVTSP